MDFRLIREGKLRVLLSAEDMASMELRYEAMDLADPATRAALLFLLENAGRQLGFRPDGARLYIEAYSQPEGGCVLFFTLLGSAQKRGKGGQPVLFHFDGVETAIRAAAAVRERCGSRIYKSALYRAESGYRLLILPLDYADRLSVSILSEYGRLLGEGDLAAAFTEEHGKELLGENAIEVLADLDGS